MTDRILLILKTQNLTSSQFADEIGVQRSSISHILSGRNNPSLEFVTKILKRFPDINSDWILFGKGSMYRDSGFVLKDKTEIKKNSIASSNNQPDLFSINEDNNIINEQSKLSPPQVEINEIKPTDVSKDNFYPILEEESIGESMNNYTDKEEVKDIKTDEINFKNKSQNFSDIKKNEELNSHKNIEKEKLYKSVEKIVILYTDKTFRDYIPE